MKGVKSPRKKSLFLGKFCKDQEDIQQGSRGYTTRIRKLYNKDQEVLQQGSGGYLQVFFGIVASIRNGQEMLCLLYAEYWLFCFFMKFFKKIALNKYWLVFKNIKKKFSEVWETTCVSSRHSRKCFTLQNLRTEFKTNCLLLGPIFSEFF